MSIDVMRPAHSRWQEFYDRLEGPDGCNFREEPDADGKPETRWTCLAGKDKSAARRILSAMGFSRASVDASCADFEAHGGYCDCEILFNVERSYANADTVPS